MTACKRELELVKLVKEGVSQLGTGGNRILSRGNRKCKVFVLRGSVVTRKYKVGGSKVADAAEGQEP